MPEDISGKLVFAIPFRPWTSDREWSTAEKALRQTVKSILNSDDPRFLVVIAAHEKPSLAGFECENVVLLDAPFEKPEGAAQGTMDKARKRRLIGSWLKQQIDQRCRVFFCDADDLVSNSLVGNILSTPGQGHVVQQGYLFDASRLELEEVKDNFFRRCGSSFSLEFSREELPNTWKDKDNVYGKFANHTKVVDVCLEEGKTFSYIHRPSVIYRINHESSLEYMKKGQKAIKKPMKVSSWLPFNEEFSLDIADTDGPRGE